METLHDRLDAHITQHPFQAMAGALVAGALAGMRAAHRRPHADAAPRGRLAALAVSLAGAIAMKVAREVAMRQLGRYVQDRWGSEHGAHARA